MQKATLHVSDHLCNDTYTLKNVDHGARGDLDVIIEQTIKSSNYSTIYRSQIIHDNKKIDVVFKFCLYYQRYYMIDLDVEAKAYRDLVELQGRAIPYFYGLYKGKDNRGKDVGCIMLEDCGESVQEFFFKLSAKHRASILNKLGEMHTAGYHHGDFAERSVVHRGDDFRLVDFHSIMDHKCNWKSDFNWVEGARIDFFEFPCLMMRHLAISEMRIWRRKTRAVQIGMEFYYDVDEFPPQEVIESLVPMFIFPVAENQKRLVAWVKGFKALMEKEADEDKDALIMKYRKTIPTFEHMQDVVFADLSFRDPTHAFLWRHDEIATI